MGDELSVVNCNYINCWTKMPRKGATFIYKIHILLRFTTKELNYFPSKMLLKTQQKNVFVMFPKELAVTNSYQIFQHQEKAEFIHCVTRYDSFNILPHCSSENFKLRNDPRSNLYEKRRKKTHVDVESCKTNSQLIRHFYKFSLKGMCFCLLLLIKSV